MPEVRLKCARKTCRSIKVPFVPEGFDVQLERGRFGVRVTICPRCGARQLVQTQSAEAVRARG